MMTMAIPAPRPEDDTRFWTRDELEGMTTEEIIHRWQQANCDWRKPDSVSNGT